MKCFIVEMTPDGRRKLWAAPKLAPAEAEATAALWRQWGIKCNVEWLA